MEGKVITAHRFALIAYSLISAAYTGCWIWRHVLSSLVEGALPTGIYHYSSSDPLGYLIFIYVIIPLVLLAFVGSLAVLLLSTALHGRASVDVYAAACAWLCCFQGFLSFASLQGCVSLELGPHGNPLIVAWWIAAIAISIALAVFTIIVSMKAKDE